MELIAQGAEAILLRENDILIKKRIEKKYRIKQLDIKLRKERTKLESSLLSTARRVGVLTPKVVDVDMDEFSIKMEFIEGKKVKEILDTLPKRKIAILCKQIGRYIGKLHKAGIIHGDLTTSNMLLKDGDLYFIDFGLGFYSQKIEDKGTDLKLLKDVIKSTHFKILNVCWRNIVKGYKEEYTDANKVLKRVEEIEKRGRYKKR
ncbi:MAG: Kae1-associated serine/threonine protein kinase [Candidatus Aenigmarchaeota archaeon]|nr:Kae1-associated serine/threonine protein kinase [Candidatus Aenigmarchaeota archaeon]